MNDRNRELDRQLKQSCIEVGKLYGVPVEENDTFLSWWKKFVNVLTLEELEMHEKFIGKSSDGPMGQIIQVAQDRKRQLMEERYSSLSVKKGERRWIKQKRKLRLKTSS